MSLTTIIQSLPTSVETALVGLLTVLLGAVGAWSSNALTGQPATGGALAAILGAALLNWLTSTARLYQPVPTSQNN